MTALMSARAANAGTSLAMVSTVTHPVPTPILTLSSLTSGSLGLDSLEPVIFIERSGPSSTSESNAVSTYPAGPAEMPGKLLQPIAALPPLQSSTGAVSSGTMTKNSAVVPDSRHVEVDGSFDSEHGSMTLQIPVGPMIHEVGLTLHANSGSNAIGSPMLDKMELVDPQGDTIAALGPLWNPQTNSPIDSVTVSLDNAPVGGSLIVQISVPPGANSLGPLPTGSGWTLPFVMDVQKAQGLASGGTGTLGSLVGSLPVSGQSNLGTLTWSTDRREEHSDANSTASADAGSGGVSLDVVAARATQPARGDESVDAYSETLADFSGRLQTGPLASRSAAPLGPNLATVLVDPAPAVDRHERALLQALDSRDLETDENLPVTLTRIGRSDSADEGGDTQGYEPAPDANPVTVAGLGALPLKVSAPPSGSRQADFDALLSALGHEPGPEGEIAVIAREDPTADDLTVALASAQETRRPAPDYLTSACILALGMGLTTGPLIPDLLRLIPPRSSRWRVLPAGAADSFRRSKPRR